VRELDLRRLRGVSRTARTVTPEVFWIAIEECDLDDIGMWDDFEIRFG